MPCILKERTAGSPGIITFTHSEALYSSVFRANDVVQYLTEQSRLGHWMFGVHIQGDCSHLESWPLQEWQSFIMWPEVSVPWLANVPKEKLLPLNCINFMPKAPPRPEGMDRNTDICVITRPTQIKRIYETLLLLRGLLNERPQTTATIVAPDARIFAERERTYTKNGIDKRFFESPLKLFSSQELKQLSFVCSSNESFGRFPIANSVMSDLLFRSRFLLLPTHSEGTPRVIAEALMIGTPCILSENLRSGIRPHLEDRNTIFIPDETATAAKTIANALEDYDRYFVNTNKYDHLYGAAHNLPPLRSFLEERIRAARFPIEGRWFLDELHLRLACHGQRQNYQFENRKALFFEWMDHFSLNREGLLNNFNPHDEDAVFGLEKIYDPAPAWKTALKYVRRYVPASVRAFAKKALRS